MCFPSRRTACRLKATPGQAAAPEPGQRPGTETSFIQEAQAQSQPEDGAGHHQQQSEPKGKGGQPHVGEPPAGGAFLPFGTRLNPAAGASAGGFAQEWASLGENHSNHLVPYQGTPSSKQCCVELN